MQYNFLSEVMGEMDYQTYQVLSYPHKTIFLKKWLDKKLEQDPEYEVFVPFLYVRAAPHIKTPGRPFITDGPGWFISNKGRLLSKLNSKEGKFIKPCITDSDQLEVSYSVKRNRTYFRVARAVATVFIPTPNGVEGHLARVNYYDKNNHNLCHKNIYWEPMLAFA